MNDYLSQTIFDNVSTTDGNLYIDTSISPYSPYNSEEEEQTIATESGLVRIESLLSELNDSDATLVALESIDYKLDTVIQNFSFFNNLFALIAFCVLVVVVLRFFSQFFK